MKHCFSKITLLSVLFFLGSCGGDSDMAAVPPAGDVLALEKVVVGTVSGLDKFEQVAPCDAVRLEFSTGLDVETIDRNIILSRQDGGAVDCGKEYDGERVVTLRLAGKLASFSAYRLVVNSGLKSDKGVPIITGKVIPITTGEDTADKFPQISDEELLDKVQEATFRYFWDGADAASGMARERTGADVVTTGGTGFGVMAICVAAERGFVTRGEACARINRIVDFLDTKATKYHGAFSHWIDGTTGQTVPFSPDDDGGDLVETGLLFEGLLMARAYFDGTQPDERRLRENITKLWEAVEWDFYTKEGQENALYWHWSATKGWAMNLKISGWNEGLIVYALAAASPTHPISKEVYDQGWAGGGAMRNGKSFYGVQLPLGPDLGGPLFFAHYSFLGLDPHRLSDAYCPSYFEQNRAHAQIHYNYCVANPKSFKGYGKDCWGLTASDSYDGYWASSPSQDKGTIAPTAALASMPYLPEESLAALRYYYYKLGDRLWSDYGFVDAFNLSESWFDTGMHLAIDQGPIVVMLENYRSGKPWKWFMSDPQILAGLKKLGFTVAAAE